jgi:hypothetical protein
MKRARNKCRQGKHIPGITYALPHVTEYPGLAGQRHLLHERLSLWRAAQAVPAARTWGLSAATKLSLAVHQGGERFSTALYEMHQLLCLPVIGSG